MSMPGLVDGPVRDNSGPTDLKTRAIIVGIGRVTHTSSFPFTTELTFDPRHRGATCWKDDFGQTP
jgi:hypothetical protein